jgi:hypothetical protein
MIADGGDTAAWPSTIDDFVEWAKARVNLGAAA